MRPSRRVAPAVKNHQLWYNLQWSKAENNPGWAIGFSKSANANTSSACPNQVNFCSAAVAAAQNKTVTGASQNVGIAVATAVLAARLNDGSAAWSPLSLSLNNPTGVTPFSSAGYQVTANNNYTNAVALSSNTFGSSWSITSSVSSIGDNSSVPAASRVDGPRRNAKYADAQLGFAPYGSATAPGVLPYSLSPAFGATAGFVVSPQSASYASAATTLQVAPSTASELSAASAGVFAAPPNSSYAAFYNDAQASAFYWRLGAGSHGLPGHFSTIAAVLLNSAATPKVSLLQAAQLHAQLHTAIHDAAAAAWALKQAQLSPRPETLLSAAPGAWQPLLANPPYPAFPSAHASVCAAAAKVLSNFFGGDAIPGAPLVLTSSDSWQLYVSSSSSTPVALVQSNNAYVVTVGGVITAAVSTSTNNGITRSFSTFSALAQDCANSRVAGGVQFPSSVAAGAALGAAVGADVLAQYPGALGAAMPKVWNFLSYVPPATVTSAAPRAAAGVALAAALLAALL